MKRHQAVCAMILGLAVFSTLGQRVRAQNVPTPAPTKALDLAVFRRAMAQRHEIKAKQDPRIKNELNKLEKITRWVPLLPGPWVALGGIESETGNVERAEKDFQIALRLSNGWTGGPGLYAAFLSSLGRNGEAQAVLRSLSGLHPWDGWVARIEAWVVSQTDDERARQLREALWKADPQADDVLFQIALQEYTKGDFSTCESNLEQLRKRHPACRDVLEWQWRCASAGGRSKDAVRFRADLASMGRECPDITAWVDALADDTPGKALAFYGQAAERYSYCPDLWRKLGWAQEAAGRPIDARVSYRRAKELLGVPDPFLDQRLEELGGAKVEQKERRDKPSSWRGNAKRTLEDLESRVFVREADWPMELILRIAREKDCAAALRDWLERWKERYPVSVSLAVSESYVTEGKEKEALSALTEATLQRPLDPRPFVEECALLDRMGRWKEGVETCDRWSRTDMGEGPLVWKGKFLVGFKRYQEAEPLLKEALQRHPERFVAWEEWIQTLDALGKRDAAEFDGWNRLQWTPLDLKAWEETARGEEQFLSKDVREKIIRELRR